MRLPLSGPKTPWRNPLTFVSLYLTRKLSIQFLSAHLSHAVPWNLSGLRFRWCHSNTEASYCCISPSVSCWQSFTNEAYRRKAPSEFSKGNFTAWWGSQQKSAWHGAGFKTRPSSEACSCKSVWSWWRWNCAAGWYCISSWTALTKSWRWTFLQQESVAKSQTGLMWKHRNGDPGIRCYRSGDPREIARFHAVWSNVEDSRATRIGKS